MFSQIYPLSRKENIIEQQLPKELLIYDLKIDKAYCLNKTSALVWQLCDGKNSVSDISQNMSKKIETVVSEEFVWLALVQFKREGLLENATNIESDFGGLSRREVIRKVGYISLVAFPVISSIVAPSVAMAQSGGLAAGASCASDSQCASGNCSNFSPSVCCLGPGEAQPGTVVSCGSLLDTSCNSRRADCCSGRASSQSVFSTLCLGNPLPPCVCN